MAVLEREGADRIDRGTGAGTEDGVDGGVQLGDGWAVRLGQGSRGRLALEVYAQESLLDVMVEGALTTELLRGARRAAPGTPVLAWGLLPAHGRPPLVRFGRGGGDAADARIIAERFWVALGDPTADRVAATSHPGAAWQELRVSPLR